MVLWCLFACCNMKLRLKGCLIFDIGIFLYILFAIILWLATRDFIWMLFGIVKLILIHIPRALTAVFMILSNYSFKMTRIKMKERVITIIIQAIFFSIWTLICVIITIIHPTQYNIVLCICMFLEMIIEWLIDIYFYIVLKHHYLSFVAFELTIKGSIQHISNGNSNQILQQQSAELRSIPRCQINN